MWVVMCSNSVRSFLVLHCCFQAPETIYYLHSSRFYSVKDPIVNDRICSIKCTRVPGETNGSSRCSFCHIVQLNWGVGHLSLLNSHWVRFNNTVAERISCFYNEVVRIALCKRIGWVVSVYDVASQYLVAVWACCCNFHTIIDDSGATLEGWRCPLETYNCSCGSWFILLYSSGRVWVRDDHSSISFDRVITLSYCIDRSYLCVYGISPSKTVWRGTQDGYRNLTFEWTNNARICSIAVDSVFSKCNSVLLSYDNLITENWRSSIKGGDIPINFDHLFGLHVGRP